MWHISCDIQLEDEPPLLPRRLSAFDGNNSAKCTATSGTADHRVFDSDYFLSRENVDVFKDEVKSRSNKASVDDCSDAEVRRSLSCCKLHELITTIQDEDAVNDAPWIDEDTEDVDRYTRVDPCTKNWKASAAEHKKRALDVYDITGIFASACRHGFILKVCEMVRSGEL